MKQTIGLPAEIVILTITIWLSGGLSTYSVAVFGAPKCSSGPDFAVTIFATSGTVQKGSSASFPATVQSICDFGGNGHYSRSLTPTVTNGPQLPPPICYHSHCNITALATTTIIGTTISTNSTTPTGSYTFTLTVTLSDCQIIPCVTRTHSASATLTVT